MGERAVIYRNKNNITKDIADGTAVNIVTMVFGNMGNDCATGVVFTRNPADGTKQIFGEYLINAQGEDVVAGVRTGKPVDLLNTAFIASSNCPNASEGNGLPECFSQIFLYSYTTCFKDFSFNALSA